MEIHTLQHVEADLVIYHKAQARFQASDTKMSRNHCINAVPSGLKLCICRYQQYQVVHRTGITTIHSSILYIVADCCRSRLSVPNPLQSVKFVFET